MDNLEQYVEARKQELIVEGKFNGYWDESLTWSIQEYYGSKGEFSDDDVEYLRKHHLVPEDFYEEEEIAA